MTVQEMAEIHAACFAGAQAWPAPEIAKILANPHCFAISRPGGFALGQIAAGEAEILTLAVAPAARRQGIGQTLVRAFMQQAREQGAETAFLEVAADNTAAIALYSRCGFAQTGLRRAYYRGADGARTDALIMTNSLAAQGCNF